MADRTSARIFGQLFTHIAQGTPLTHDVLWDMCQRYDFHPCQMDINEILISLGLARRHKFTVDGFEESEMYYKGDREFDKEPDQ